MTHPDRPAAAAPAVRVAVLGAGSVGSEVVRFLASAADELAARAGARLELAGIAVRNLDRELPAGVDRALLTTDAERLVDGADVVVELMGGIEPARSLIRRALEAGADVITANKALIATHGAELFQLAERVGAQLLYEAAVAGAIPIIRPLRDSLAGDTVRRVLGIVNGTTNFILDRMTERGDSFEEALRIATELGYAEADPTADIEGFDAQQKASILASIAFHTGVPVDAVHREGITRVTVAEIEAARRAGSVVKLLAICERMTGEDGRPAVSVRVHPTLVPEDHPLAAVHGGNNAVFVEAVAAGDLMFYGAGAGGTETSSAVLGDLVSAVRRRVLGGPGLGESTHAELPVVGIGETVTRCQISLDVDDAPGVLAAVAGVLARHGVSVATLEQSGPGRAAGLDRPAGGEGAASAPGASLIIGTHPARERDLAAVVQELGETDAVREVAGVLRIASGF